MPDKQYQKESVWVYVELFPLSVFDLFNFTIKIPHDLFFSKCLFKGPFPGFLVEKKLLASSVKTLH